MTTITIPKNLIKRTMIIIPKIKKEIPKEWVRAKGIWPDKIDPVRYQKKLRKQYGY